jgi:hypothetical protein
MFLDRFSTVRRRLAQPRRPTNQVLFVVIKTPDDTGETLREAGAAEAQPSPLTPTLSRKNEP